jgi:alkanesulfonate monooxygenase SsuD/methylene tetrahydromethanopterin reductase-like flavin-dependent oxidoreductase (luciferase family)
MKFGVFDHMDRAQPDLAAQYADRLELIRAYDRGGLHGYHMAEHHGTPLGLAPSPSVFLAAAAQHTERLRLGTLVYTLALYHPLRLAEEICMLDHITGGRFDLGIGRGISPIELSFYGLTEEEANERFVECRDIVLAALTSERLTHDGTRYRFDDVPMVIRPVQQPHPPLWYGVSRPSSCAWAAANDVNVVMNGPAEPIRAITDTYRAEWARLGKPAGELPLVGCSRHIVIADSDHEAVAIASRAYPQWWQSLQLLWQERGITPPFISYPPTAEEAISGGYVIAGSTGAVRALIGELIPQTGITYLLCRFAFGQMPAAAAQRSVELFVREVMPAFAGDETAR